MESASTWPISARRPLKSDSWPLGTALPAFVLALALLACAQAGLVMAGGPADAGPRFSGGGAHGMSWSHGIPGLAAWLGRAGAAPAWLPLVPDLLAAAAVVALLWRDAAPRQGRMRAWLMAGLFLLQPLFVRAVLAGNGTGMTLLALYGICRGASRVRSRADVVGYLILATWLAWLLLADVQTWPIIVALAICLFPCMPSGLFRRAPLTYHLVVFLPVAFTVLALLYTGWWLGDPEVLLRGADAVGDGTPVVWPVPAAGPGVGWWASLIVLAGIIVVAAWGQSQTRRVAWSVSAALACAGVFAWSVRHAWGGDQLALFFAPAALVVGESLPRQRGWILGLLLMGALTVVALF